MKIISHRGNIHGPEPETENMPSAIDHAIVEGYDVEVDVWWAYGKLFLGHDEPQYSIDYSFLLERKEKLWVHAKNRAALNFLVEQDEQVNYFWHQEDEYTLTSSGKVWAYPGALGGPNVVTVMPEIRKPYDLSDYYGICTDYPEMYRIHKEVPFSKKGA